jgi:uncharacterized protein YkwD
MERNAVEDLLAVCEVFVELPEASPDAITTQKMLDMINARRLRKGRFALGLDDDLSRMARQSARRLIALGKGADPQSEGDALMEELTEGHMTLADAAIRYFHTHNPAQVLAAPEIYGTEFNRLGVGIARSGDASRAGELWIALIFAGR